MNASLPAPPVLTLDHLFFHWNPPIDLISKSHMKINEKF